MSATARHIRDSRAVARADNARIMPPREPDPVQIEQQSELIRDMRRTIESLCDCIDQAADEMAREAMEPKR